MPTLFPAGPHPTNALGTVRSSGRLGGTLVSSDLHPGATAASPARLLIHSSTEPTCAASGALGRAMLWLTLRVSHLLKGRAPALASVVQIDDLLGRRFFDSEQARPLIEVTLRAGTYHVTVRLGILHRRYTVTLEQGATFHLHLRSTIDHP